MNYVNASGKPVIIGEPDSHKKKPKPKAMREDFHKGWRVVGHKPGAFEEAVESNRRVQGMAERAGGAPIPDLVYADWLRITKKKPVRAKPYEVPEAANVCAELAKKAGWLCVEVVEIKRGE